MANECLVTKLKGTVNNNNLPRFGGFRLNVEWSDDTCGDYQNRFICYGVDYYIYPISGSISYKKATNLSDPWTLIPSDGLFVSINDMAVFVRGSGVIEIVSKYTLGGIFLSYAIGSSEIYSELPYMSNCSNLTAYGQRNTVDFSSIEVGSTVLEWLGVENANLRGTINKIHELYPNLKQLTVSYNGALTGALADFADFNEITMLDFVGINITDSDKSIETLVRAFRTKQPSKNALEFLNPPSILTFNGQAITAGTSLSWTSTTITFNGVTIDA